MPFNIFLSQNKTHFNPLNTYISEPPKVYLSISEQYAARLKKRSAAYFVNSIIASTVSVSRFTVL